MHIRKLFGALCLAALGLIATTSSLFAAGSQEHFTVIVNQVRGSECCDVGSSERFQQQQQMLQERALVGNFALRYDVLQDRAYLDHILSDSKNEYGAFFEVTPQLAKDAGVTYKSEKDKWYEAQNAYLIGYTIDERRKLIDQYMSVYKKNLGKSPLMSSGWMIDPWSLKYLKEKYGVIAHQLTREQFGTDSYTLYGGPVHYPYFPSEHWAMIPQAKKTSPQPMPLIFRQTITDPVFNYGDTSNSYTSQPNDYFLRKENIRYFRHLFSQAHQQQNAYTFAVIGLENSMPETAQREFQLQLDEVADWQQKSQSNRVLTVSEFAKWFEGQATQRQNDVTSYEGASANDSTEKAWWITTPTYRARVRLSAGELFLSDLRLYSPDFSDPYETVPAKSLGWWIVPYVLDSSRYYGTPPNGEGLKNDLLKNRTMQFSPVPRIVLASRVQNASLIDTAEGKVLQTGAGKIALFGREGIEFGQPPNLEPLAKLPAPLADLAWTDTHKSYWGFSHTGNTWQPFINVTNLDQVRAESRSLLFPEKQFQKIDSGYTTLFVNNDHSVATRNPIRLAFFPKNAQGEAILLSGFPRVTTKPELKDISIYEQHQRNGMIFIDINSATPLTSQVTVTYDDFHKELPVYFAPNCKEKKLYCLLHPRQAWWYVKSYLADRARAKEEAKQKREMFAE